MKFLLDTQLVLFSLLQPKRLSAQARRVLENSSNTLVFSVVSVWEISIKRGLGRPGFQADPNILRNKILRDGWEELVVLGSHALAVASLPPIHKDPFDRLLIAQAMVEGITLLTADETIAKYPGPIRKV
jgi:PIN domain nuclease of toxin-antitoxin system